MSTSIRERSAPVLQEARAERGAGTAAYTARPCRLAINGKFTAQRMTGVQRVAYELTAELARIASADEAPSLVVPSDHDPAAMPAGARSLTSGRRHGARRFAARATGRDRVSRDLHLAAQRVAC